jgi:phage baseplate assembly protein gpV
MQLQVLFWKEWLSGVIVDVQLAEAFKRGTMAQNVPGAPHVQDGDPAQFPDRFAVWLKESNDIAVMTYNQTTMNGTVDQVRNRELPCAAARLDATRGTVSGQAPHTNVYQGHAHAWF